MHKRWLILLLLLVLGSCSSAEEAADTTAPAELPTAAAPAAVDVEIEVESPRAEDEPEESGLPPTFTPEPTLPPNDSAPVSVEVNELGTPMPQSAQQTYTVQAGDTLAEIAADFGITLDALVEANNIADIDQIEIGDTLVIP